MYISLKDDFEKVYQYLSTRVANFDISKNISPEGKSGFISLISLGYQFDQSGWVALIFDTREGARPDGEWASYIEENILEMKHWFEQIDRVYEENTP